MTTVSGALSTVPSSTISSAKYVPATSASNVGLTEVGSDSIAVLPTGTVVSDQLNVNASPSTSLEPLPSNVTMSFTSTV